MGYPLLVGKKLVISDPVSGCVNDSGHIFDYWKEWKVHKAKGAVQIERKKRPSREQTERDRGRDERASLRKHRQTPHMPPRLVKLIPPRAVFLFCDIQLKFRVYSSQPYERLPTARRACHPWLRRCRCHGQQTHQGCQGARYPQLVSQLAHAI
jgi:hypothetical protein